MSIEALEVKIRFTSQVVKARACLEKHDLSEIQDKMYSISEDLGLLKNLVGADSHEYKELDSINNSLKSRVDTVQNERYKHL